MSGGVGRCPNARPAVALPTFAVGVNRASVTEPESFADVYALDGGGVWPAGADGVYGVKGSTR